MRERISTHIKKVQEQGGICPICKKGLKLFGKFVEHKGIFYHAKCFKSNLQTSEQSSDSAKAEEHNKGYEVNQK